MKQLRHGQHQIVLPREGSSVQVGGCRISCRPTLHQKGELSRVWVKLRELEDASKASRRKIDELEHRVVELEAGEEKQVSTLQEEYIAVEPIDLPSYTLSHERFIVRASDARDITEQFRRSMSLTQLPGRAGAVCYALSMERPEAMIIALKPWSVLVPDPGKCYEYPVELPMGFKALGFGVRDLGVRIQIFPRDLGGQNPFFGPAIETFAGRAGRYPPLMLSGTDPDDLVSWISDDKVKPKDGESAPVQHSHPVEYRGKESPGIIFPVNRRRNVLLVCDGAVIRSLLVPPTNFGGRDDEWQVFTEGSQELLPWFSRPVEKRYVVMAERHGGRSVVLDLQARKLNYLMAKDKPLFFPAGWRFVGVFNRGLTSAFLKQEGQVITLILEPVDRIESCLKRTMRMTTAD